MSDIHAQCWRMRVPGQGRYWAMGSAVSTGRMDTPLVSRAFLTSPCSLDPRGPSFCSQGAWPSHMDPASHGPTLPRPYRGLALGPWLCNRPVGGSSPNDTGAHSPGFLADPGRVPGPPLASCSVNTARLMVRNCQSPIGCNCLEDVLKIRAGRPVLPPAHHSMFSWQGFSQGLRKP